MAELYVAAEREIGAPAEQVYRYIADYREHHHRFLPPAFTDFKVEQGGVGAGTVVTFRGSSGGISRDFRGEVAEPEPGRVLTESYPATGMVTTFIVTPAGERCQVRIETRWSPSTGLMGVIERLAAPAMLRRLYADELERLDRYAREQAVGQPTG
jgi:uncharacterized protein YndB with AHSA1/START domain